MFRNDRAMPEALVKLAVASVLTAALSGGVAPPAIAEQAPPTAPVLVGVGDSITYGTGTPNPPATSYICRTADLLSMRCVDLGVPGALTGRIGEEVQLIPLDASIVVIYAGTNDVAASSERSASPAEAVHRTQYFEPGFDVLVASVRARVPLARLIVITVRDFGRVQKYFKLTDPLHDADNFTAAVHEWDAHLRTVAASAGAEVLDLETDAQWYAPDEYGAPGEIHPDNRGSARLARMLARLIDPRRRLDAAPNGASGR